MLKIKLSRTGKKNAPTYRFIVCEHTKDPWGDSLEILGHYNPRSKELVLKKERVEHWISKGAQPTETVHNILVTEGILKTKKKNVSALGKKAKEKAAEEKKKEKAAPKKEEKTEKVKEESEEHKQEPAPKAKEEMKATKELKEESKTKETKEPKEENKK